MTIIKGDSLKQVFMVSVTTCILSACGGGAPPQQGAQSSAPVNNSSANSNGGNSSAAQASSSSTGSQNTDPGLAVVKNWYVELPDGRGGTNIEGFAITPEMGFDKSVSQAAFEQTVYPILRQNCSACHSTINGSASGAQAPLHSDVDPALAHEYALTRVNFRNPGASKLVFRLEVDRHNCFASSCSAAANEMEQAIAAWGNAVSAMLPEVPRGLDAGTRVSEQEILSWIETDQNNTPAADREFIKYASFHEMHNAGMSAQDLNHARVGLSKALNSVARWAPDIVNPTDVNGKGILYRLDIRDYWGWSKIDTSGNFQLFYGGSDDDLAFGSRVDLNNNPVSYFDLADWNHRIQPTVKRDDKFARVVWARILKGNAEGADQQNRTLPPYIDGFIGPKTRGAHGQDIVRPEDLKYVEASQLTFTVTRPDVYNAIMALPGYSHRLEDDELGVDKSQGTDSFDWVLTQEAITIDSRLYYRSEAQEGRGKFYWKTYDIFTTGGSDVEEDFANDDVRFPFWANPIPKFISTQQGGTTPDKFAMVATVNLFNRQSSGQEGGGYYDGSDGGQQSAEEAIWSLPNGLQGYALFGGFNQRRVDAFTNIVRDPRLMRHHDVADEHLDDYTGFGTRVGVPDIRLNNGSSCIGCHQDGMNRGNNDLRDWLEDSPGRLPSGQYGVDGWINNTSTVNRVKELYPTSAYIRGKMEQDRAVFAEAMGKIKSGMILGADKNVYTEPTIWVTEWAREFYDYPFTRSN